MKIINKIATIYFICLASALMFIPHIAEGSTSNGSLFSISDDGRGNFVSVWVEDASGIPVIKSSTLNSQSTHATWSDPVRVSTPGTFSNSPIVEMDGQGNAVALWRSVAKDNPNYNLEAAMLPIGGIWTTPVIISKPNELISTNNIELKVSADGNIVAIWGSIMKDPDEPNKTRQVIRAATAQFGGNWSRPIMLSRF